MPTNGEPAEPEPSDAALSERLARTLAPAYELNGELGRGGMAIVYGARDARLKRRVAVKLLPPELAFRADIRSRFLREAETAARLNHPNIVQIFSVDERDGLVYFVMAFVQGGSLGDRLRERGALSVDDTRRIVREVAGALGYAHRNGVVHRDIKPDNILLDSDSGRSMLTDFGIARATSGDDGGTRLTATGVAMGTPTYMSPEQCTGDRDIDARSDLYSLGAVAYQMLAGEPPFVGNSTPAVMVKHVTEAPIPPRERRADIPRDLNDIILKLLEKEPANRFATGEEVVAALDSGDFVAPRRTRTSARDRVPEVDAAVAAAIRMRAERIDEARARFEERAISRQERRDARRREKQGDVSPAVVEMFMQGGERRDAKRRAKRGEQTPAERVRTVRRQVASYVGTSAFLLGINYLTGDGFWWALFPIAAMTFGTLTQLGKLWADGFPIGSVFTGRLPAGAQLPAVGPGATAAQGSPQSSDVSGRHGDALRQAIADNARIQDSIARLSETERKALPDVKATADALFTRIQALAPALHRLDVEIGTDRAKSLDERIALIEDQPGDAADRERRLKLLRRQREVLSDLESSRAKLLEQYETACLLLQNIALDLLKVRSSGLDSALGGITSATQEARALSREINYVLHAADELRELESEKPRG